MEITSVSCPGQIEPGRPFELSIEHTGDCAGRTVNLRASPRDTFAVEPRTAVLGPGRTTGVTCVVTRRRASASPCTLGVSLFESERFVTRSVS